MTDIFCAIRLQVILLLPAIMFKVTFLMTTVAFNDSFAIHIYISSQCEVASISRTISTSTISSSMTIWATFATVTAEVEWAIHIALHPVSFMSYLTMLVESLCIIQRTSIQAVIVSSLHNSCMFEIASIQFAYLLLDDLLGYCEGQQYPHISCNRTVIPSVWHPSVQQRDHSEQLQEFQMERGILHTPHLSTFATHQPISREKRGNKCTCGLLEDLTNS
jgi:hypothetical protein